MSISKYNPFFPYGMNPYQGNFGQPMKTPEQYRQDILAQLKPQFDNYDNMYMQNQRQMNIQNNSGNYTKVNSYEEVKNIDAPASGKPIIIIDETNGVLYSKKFENGQQFIKAFNLVPQETKQESQENAQKSEKTSENDNSLDLILKKLNDFDNRLKSIEGEKANVNSTDVIEQTETK